jgi:hypothetical protein
MKVKMEEHEKECSFNPIHKKCWTCEHHGDEGYYGDSYPVCNQVPKMSVLDGQEQGNCEGWEPSDISELRKMKLEQLNKL